MKIDGEELCKAQTAACFVAHQSHEGRSWFGGFQSAYRVVYTVGSVVKL